MKKCEKYIYSAPGKLILIGEYAVLSGKRCISMSIDKRIKVELRPSQDSKITIYSDLGSYSISIANLYKINFNDIPSNFKFALMTFKNFNIKTGAQLIINSDFPPNFGLSSSVSVVVATVSCIMDWLGLKLNLKNEETLKNIFDESYKVILNIRNNNFSGYDIATIIWGGIIEFSNNPFFIKKIKYSNDFPISVIYSGYEIDTDEAIKIVKDKSINFSDEYKKIYELIDSLIEKAKKAIEKSDWKTLGNIFNINQGLLDSIGINDKTLSELIYWTRENGALGSKISGAGLGDCIIVLGKIPQYDNIKNQQVKTLSLKVGEFGLKKE